MAFVHNFKQSMEVGKRGEEHIIYYLQSSPKVVNLKDVRNDRTFQKIDVDFLMTLDDNVEYKVEVKTDTYKSGNIYYETISSQESDTEGCFEKTQADYLFYYFINWGYLYIFSMPEYKDWFGKMENEFIEKGYQKQVKNSGYKNSQYTSIGYAYPVSILEDLNPSWMRKLEYNYEVA